MIVAVSLLVAGMGSLALVILELRKAPKGYEDECGFHAVQRVRSGTLSPVQDKERSRSRIVLPSGNQKNDSGAIPCTTRNNIALERQLTTRSFNPSNMKRLLLPLLLFLCLAGDTITRAISATTSTAPIASQLTNISTRAFVQTATT